MSVETNKFMGKVFVGKPVQPGHSADKYGALLMPDEKVS
jgi:hypothetical protein